MDISYKAANRISGFTVLNDGRVYASIQSLDRPHSFNRGLFVLANDNAGVTAKWVRVSRGSSPSNAKRDVFRVPGSDDSEVVYRTSVHEVSWAEVRTDGWSNR